MVKCSSQLQLREVCGVLGKGCKPDPDACEPGEALAGLLDDLGVKTVEQAQRRIGQLLAFEAAVAARKSPKSKARRK